MLTKVNICIAPTANPSSIPQWDNVHTISRIHPAILPKSKVKGMDTPDCTYIHTTSTCEQEHFTIMEVAQTNDTIAHSTLCLCRHTPTVLMYNRTHDAGGTHYQYLYNKPL